MLLADRGSACIDSPSVSERTEVGNGRMRLGQFNFQRRSKFLFEGAGDMDSDSAADFSVDMDSPAAFMTGWRPVVVFRASELSQRFNCVWIP